MNVQYCQRCGSTLPDQEEGICPGCGTPFGARTVAISVGAGDLLAAHEAKMRQASSAQPAPTPLAAPAKGASGTGSGAVALMVGVAGLVVLLVVVIAFLLLRPA